MPEAVSQTMLALCVVTQNLPIGTNLGLLHFLWMLLSGSLLPGRGALFPALQAIGLSPPAVRRAWAAFRCGAWEIGVLLFISMPRFSPPKADRLKPRALARRNLSAAVGGTGFSPQPPSFQLGVV